jgi:predicted dehydrogenase
MSDEQPNYDLTPESAGAQIEAPELPYRPRDPQGYRPRIGLVGCGGISSTHLTAYRRAGYEVLALCSRDVAKARAHQQEFYPQATVYADYRELFAREDVDVVDLTPHPEDRLEMTRAAIGAGKHVLCQKPFVLDLDVGQELVELARRRGVQLSVNQNGRFAPHFSYLRELARGGWLGPLQAIHTEVHWDHNWIHNLPFDRVRHILLFDFAVHWFDFAASLMGDRPARRVYASFARSGSQRATPPLLAQALVEYDDAQVSLVFDADTRLGAEDRTVVIGSRGTARSTGASLTAQTVTVYTPGGWFSPRLEGTWFPDGFHGTMADLATAIAAGTEPLCNARENLNSLALCFAAVESAETHRAVVPGTARRLVGPGGE